MYSLLLNQTGPRPRMVITMLHKADTNLGEHVTIRVIRRIFATM